METRGIAFTLPCRTRAQWPRQSDRDWISPYPLTETNQTKQIISKPDNIYETVVFETLDIRQQKAVNPPSEVGNKLIEL